MLLKLVIYFRYMNERISGFLKEWPFPVLVAYSIQAIVFIVGTRIYLAAPNTGWKFLGAFALQVAFVLVGLIGVSVGLAGTNPSTPRSYRILLGTSTGLIVIIILNALLN